MFEGFQGTVAPVTGAPPQGLLAFYWHFVKQTKGWYAAMFAASLATAALDTVLPLFIGRLVSLMEATDRMAALEAQWPLLVAMVVLVLVARPLVAWVDVSIRHMVLIPGATCLIRWQSHWHVVRQSWPFFQNDFAGRIANRVMQTAHALRDSVMASIRAVWYIGAYGVIALTLMATVDWRLGLPTLGWFVGYVALLWYFVPRMRDLARTSSEARSLVMARVVDSYTNILTVKLFARLTDEDAYVRDSIDEHGDAMRRHMRVLTRFFFLLTALNAALLVGTAAIGIWLWAHGAVGAGIVAAALPLAWQLSNERSSQISVGLRKQAVGVLRRCSAKCEHRLLDAAFARLQRVLRFRVGTARDLRHDPRRAMLELGAVRPHRDHQPVVDVAKPRHDEAGEKPQRRFLRRAGVQARRTGDHLRTTRQEDRMIRVREERRVAIVGDGDDERARLACRFRRGNRERRRAARGDSNCNVAVAQIQCSDQCARVGGIVLVRSACTGIEPHALGQHEGDALGRPAEGRAELHPVERRLPAGGAGADIDDAADRLDASGNGARRRRDCCERRAHRRDRPHLSLPERIEDVGVAPGVEAAIARAENLRVAHWSSVSAADMKTAILPGSHRQCVRSGRLRRDARTIVHRR